LPFEVGQKKERKRGKLFLKEGRSFLASLLPFYFVFMAGEKTEC
jgi:hypothetical protein